MEVYKLFAYEKKSGWAEGGKATQSRNGQLHNILDVRKAMQLFRSRVKMLYAGTFWKFNNFQSGGERKE